MSFIIISQYLLNLVVNTVNIILLFSTILKQLLAMNTR